MIFKKSLLTLAVLSCFASAPVYADIIDGIEDIVDEALDADDTMVRVISAASNFADIDGSVSITAEQINIGSSTTSATAVAEEAIAVAISGNRITTTAIGAVNNTEVDIANAIQYDAAFDSTTSITGEDTGVLGLNGGIGNNVFVNLDIGSGFNGGPGFGEDFFDGQELTYNNVFGEDTGDVYNGVAAFQAAFNYADINASVTIAASPSYDLDSFWDRNRELTQNTITMANVDIATTAIGAANSGGVKVDNALSQSLTATTSLTQNDTASTE